MMSTHSCVIVCGSGTLLISVVITNLKNINMVYCTQMTGNQTFLKPSTLSAAPHAMML